MSETPTNVTPPPDLTYGYVDGRIILAIGDRSDAGRMPDPVPADGMTVTFTPANTILKVASPTPATVIKQPIVCSVDANGYLIDGQDARGVWLVTGTYKVTYSHSRAIIPPHDIEVTTGHTDVAPLDLTTAMPPGGPVLAPSEYAELNGRLTILEAGGGGGGVTWSTISGKPAVVAEGATQADARTAIGAGTSSFSGAYADLSGKPTIPDTEAIQDVVGAMVTGAGGTYNDAAGTITLPSGGGSLTYVTANTDAPDGATPGQLVGYYNAAATAITVEGGTVAAGEYVILMWTGTAWQALGAGSGPVDPGTPTEVAPVEPIVDNSLHTITIPAVTGVIYKIDGVTTAAGAHDVTPPATVTVTAHPASASYVFAAGVTTSWSYIFTAPAGWVTAWSDPLDTGSLDARTNVTMSGRAGSPYGITDGWAWVDEVYSGGEWRAATAVMELPVAQRTHLAHAVEVEYDLTGITGAVGSVQLSVAANWSSHLLNIAGAGGVSTWEFATPNTETPWTITPEAGFNFASMSSTGTARFESDGTYASAYLNGTLVARALLNAQVAFGNLANALGHNVRIRGNGARHKFRNARIDYKAS